ncbi:MAG: inositol monophosphatase [Alphaproteobacteria bacterium]|nr:inositol monophosphatase [Alphaproteobacteria bacterium]
MARRSAHLNVMVEAAEKAARSLVRDFGEVENLQVSKKGPGDFVSNADHKAEKTIREALTKSRPNYSLLMEESGAKKGADASFKWIVDPLDGTTNFLHGIPHWSISIALEKDGEILAGVVYDPIKDELFTAEKGMGAFLNNKRLRVSPRHMADAMIAIGGARPGAKNYEIFMAEIDAVMPHVSGVRRMGSAALDICYVAAGRFDGFFERHLSPWDVAAGSLIVKEAGGYSTDMEGGKDCVYGKSFLTGSPNVHAGLLKQLKSCAKKAPEKVKSAS